MKLVKEYIVHFYSGLPREILQCLFMSITLIILSPRLFSIFSLIFLPAVVIIKKLGKKLKRRSNRALDSYSILTEWLQQRFSGIETIKQLQTENLEVEKMRVINNNLHQNF